MQNKRKLSQTLLCALMGIAILFSPFSVQANSTPFNDVADGLWYTDSIEYVYSNGIMTGYNSSQFGVNADLSRGQMMTILYRLAGQPSISSHHVFVDVDDDAYYATPIRWAYEKGITTGYTTSIFGPEDPLTREDFATFLYRYDSSAKAPSSSVLGSFPDASAVSSHALEAMNWAVSSGLISGDGGRLNPQGKSTRAVSAVILARYLKNSGQGTPGSGGQGSSGSTQNPSTPPSTPSTPSQPSIPTTNASTAAQLASAWSSLKKNTPSISASSTGRVIVRAKSAMSFADTSPASIVAGPESFYILQYTTAAQASQAAKYYSGLSGVWMAFEEPVASNSAHVSYGPGLIKSDTYKAKITSGSPVVVATIDTGADLDHSMLTSRLIAGYDFSGNDNNPQDSDGHGSHVAGTIADVTKGLDVYILPVQIFSPESVYSTDNDVVRGIDYAIAQGADVINLSIGIKGHSDLVDEAVQRALSKGITVVAAAGNDSINVSNYCPAHLSQLITVGAVDQSKNIGWYSNYGNQIDFVAPGSKVVSAYWDGSTDTLSGTSMAAPFVSAAAAMILMQHPSYTCAQVESLLKQSCEDLGQKGWDPYYGEGLIDLSKLS